MVENKLGRLERVGLRDAWSNEAGGFTPWLAEPENLRLLGETIGIDLELQAREREVGPFRADILCKDTATGDWVLIENQLEKTDHTHLGQLMTYAAGLKAVTIVWIAATFTDEHRAALDWLNEITEERFNFFGLEIELWRIGDSPVAPKFNVVSQRNEWSRTVTDATDRGELSETKLLQLEFWTAFRAYLLSSGSSLRAGKALPQHWIDVSLGRGGTKLSGVASTWDSATGKSCSGELRAEVVLFDRHAKDFFAALEGQRSIIDSEIGEQLHWHNPDNKRMCRIYVRRTADLYDRAQWPTYYQWLRERLETLHRVFSPRVRELSFHEADSDDA